MLYLLSAATAGIIALLIMLSLGRQAGTWPLRHLHNAAARMFALESVTSRCIGLALFVVLLSAPSAVALLQPAESVQADTPTNLVQNPSFETLTSDGYPANWGVRPSASADNTTAYSGVRSLKVQGPATAVYSFQRPTLAAGPYRLTGWVRTQGTLAGSGVTLRQIPPSGGGSITMAPWTKTATDWTQVSLNFTTTVSGGAQIDAMWDLRDGDIAWFDDLVLTAVQPPTPTPTVDPTGNLVQNPSFETLTSDGYPANWGVRPSASADNTTAYSGVRSLKVQGPATAVYSFQRPTLTAGPYRLTGWVRTQGTLAGSGVTLRQIPPSGGGSIASAPWTKTATDWTQVSLNFTTTVGGTGQLDVRWDLRDGDVAWFDDLTLTNLTPPSPTPSPTLTPTPSPTLTPTPTYTPTALPAENLAQNPSFESLTGSYPSNWWSRPTGATDTATVHSGARSLKVQGPAANVYSFQNPSPSLTAGMYQLTGWVRTQGTLAGNGVTLRYTRPSGGGSILAPWTKTAADWTRVSITFTTTVSGTGQLDLMWDLRDGDVAWFDDIALTVAVPPTPTHTPSPTPTFEPTANQIRNASFETLASSQHGLLPAQWQARPDIFSETTEVHTGSRSLRSVPGANDTYTYQLDLNLVPNRNYRLSTWVKTFNVQEGQGKGVRIRFVQTGPTLANWQTGFNTPSTWIKVVLDFTTPGNHQGGRVDLQWNLQPGELAWWDDVELLCLDCSSEPTATPTPTATPISLNDRPIGPTDADWPVYLANTQRTSYSPNERIITRASAPSLHPVWTAQAAGTTSMQPVVAHNLVYWGAWDGYMRATSIDGRLVWATFVGTTDGGPACAPRYLGVTSAATVHTIEIAGQPRSVLYVSGGDGKEYALDAFTGEIIWATLLATTPPNFIWAAPTVYGDYLYVGVASVGACPNTPGKMVKLDARTGELLNTGFVVNPGCGGAGLWGGSSIDPDDETVYAATGNITTCNAEYEEMAQAIVKFRSSDMVPIDHWQVPEEEWALDGDFGSTATLFTGMVDGVPTKLVGATNKNGWFYVLRRDDLEAGPVWQFELTTASGFASATFDGSVLYLTAGGTMINGVNCNSSLRAFDPGSGTVLWQKCIPYGSTQYGGPALTQELMILANLRYLQVFDKTNGNLLYEFTVPNDALLYGSASVANGIIYVADTNGVLHAFAP